MTSLEEIKLLIHRNKLRLEQELRQSKEAVSLIKKSTHANLSDEEKEKIKIQLLDICKAIPALAVFLLPGGALLLPLLIKLIPDILPSAFQDDLPNDKKKTS
ncbi:LETM1 domain-containing protein [Polaribacter sp.]|uniref:LETM1 domain-containing protein n=1 Tax=Polaribacter sp. TaxID=1920175 RepID=UPI003EF6D7ED